MGECRTGTENEHFNGAEGDLAAQVPGQCAEVGRAFWTSKGIEYGLDAGWILAMTTDDRLDILIRQQQEIISLLSRQIPASDKVRQAAAAINPGCKPTRKRRKIPQKQEA